MIRSNILRRRIGLLSTTLAVLCTQGVNAQSIEAITVTASPLETNLSDTATAVTVLSKDEIIRGGGQNLGELLGNLPGVNQSSFARGASRPIIRGLDNARVRIQENGIGSHDVAGVSEDHGVPIDPLAAQSVEVIRGAGVLRYGNEAIGGVVSVLNNRIPKAIPDNNISGEINGDASRVDDGRTLSGLLDAGAGVGAVHIDGFWRETDDYETPLGLQSETYSEAKGFAAGGSLIGAAGHIGIAYADYDAEYGIPAAEAPIFIDLRQSKTTVAAGYDFGEGAPIRTIELTGGLTDYTHDEIEAETGDIGSTFNNEEWEARLEAVHAEIAGFNGALGIQYRERDLSASGEGGELLAPNTTKGLGVFLFEQTQVTDKLSLQGAVRFESTDVDGTGLFASSFNGSLITTTADEVPVSRTFETVSAAASAVYALTEALSLGATLQRTERAPDSVELFSKGPHEATETFEIGDPDLGTESAVSAELTLKQHTEHTRLDAALFYTRFDDFIYKAYTEFVCGEEFDTCGIEGDPGVEDELTQIAFTQIDASYHGFELMAQQDIIAFGNGWFGLDARADYVRGKLNGAGNVPRIPPLRLGAGVYFEGERLFARIGALHVFEQDDVAANETSTDGYTDLQSDLVWTATPVGARTKVSFGLAGRNLLDEEARNHVSFKKADVLMPGRSVRGYVRLTF